MGRLILKLLGLIVSFFGICNLNAQILRPVKWSFASKKVSAKEEEVTLTATIDKGWHIYAQNLGEGDGPIPTSFKFAQDKAYGLEGKVKSTVEPVVEFDPTFNKKIGSYTGTVIFKQRVTTAKPVAGAVVKGTLEYMVCSNSQCLPPETVSFAIPLK